MNVTFAHFLILCKRSVLKNFKLQKILFKMLLDTCTSAVLFLSFTSPFSSYIKPFCSEVESRDLGLLHTEHVVKRRKVPWSLHWSVMGGSYTTISVLCFSECMWTSWWAWPNSTNVYERLIARAPQRMPWRAHHTQSRYHRRDKQCLSSRLFFLQEKKSNASNYKGCRNL